MKNGVTYFSDFDWRASQVGDAWQGTPLSTFKVRHHPAVSTFQRDLAKLDPFSTWHTGFRLNNLQKTCFGEALKTLFTGREVFLF